MARFAGRTIEAIAAVGDRSAVLRAVRHMAREEIDRGLTDIDRDVAEPIFDFIDDLVAQLSKPLDKDSLLHPPRAPGQPRRIR